MTSSYDTSILVWELVAHSMAGDRSEDIVLAGSGGQQASMTLSTLFTQTHRSTSLVLAIDSLIIVLIAYDLALVSEVFLGQLSHLIWAIPLFATTSTWFSYRSRKSWAYWPGAIILTLASLLFLLLFILNLYYVILGSVGSILFLLIMGYASYSSFNRMRYHFLSIIQTGLSYICFNTRSESNGWRDACSMSKLYGSSRYPSRPSFTCRHLPAL